MKIGYIGVGKWATQLREAFEARGHETVGYCRKNYTDIPEGWGDDLHYVGKPDLIVAAAPPDVVHYWAHEGTETPMLVTKPFDESLLPRPRRAPTYVDLWRVLTPEWEEFKAFQCRTERARFLAVLASGDGPLRPWVSGSMDYGPHAMAYLVDMFPGAKFERLQFHHNQNGSDGIELRYDCANIRAMNHDMADVGWDVWLNPGNREPVHSMKQPSKPAGLAKLVEHCETGNTFTWELNKRVMHELRNVPWVVK